MFKVEFQKTFIFQIDFNDFIKLWVSLGSLWGHFGGTLEQLLVYSGDFGPL